MRIKDRKFKKEERELLSWLNTQPGTRDILKKINTLQPVDWDNDPQFIADFIKGRITEDIIQAMEEEGINKSELARLLGKSRQYISRILNETANFTIDSIIEIACALNRKVEIRILRHDESLDYHKKFIPLEETNSLTISDKFESTINKKSNFNTESIVAEEKSQYTKKYSKNSK